MSVATITQRFLQAVPVVYVIKPRTGCSLPQAGASPGERAESGGNEPGGQQLAARAASAWRRRTRRYATPSDAAVKPTIAGAERKRTAASMVGAWDRRAEHKDSRLLTDPRSNGSVTSVKDSLARGIGTRHTRV